MHKKTGFIRKIRLITIHIFNISRSKCNQTVKLGQIMEYEEYFASRNHAENEARKLVPDLFLFFKKVAWGKSK